MTGNPTSPPACASACGRQLSLFEADPTTAVPEFDWDRHDVVIVGSSAGKDSAAMLHTVCQQADQAGALHKVRVLHCDLGATPNGHDIEWPMVAELARRQAALYSVPFAVRRAARWASLWDRIMAHGNWPGFFARFCTADTKTVVGRDYVDETGKELSLGRPVRAGYALGMRAEESTGRAKIRTIETHRMTGKGTLREVTTWLPIHGWTTDDVWRLHREHGIPHHEAYDQGMRRLSCRFCPLAGNEDVIRSVQLNPALAREYAAAEEHLGHPFKKNLSMRRAIQLAGI
ncbi:phosphoadenosine phosphosulfate reductase family protein [Streptomyces sp. NRRL B-24484]|uniref:phosphoadenosine phosphosulfate reductase family protein n=1 Tax=Streptomyces sp. NRRL B-24484 TaxID=1463833 RepID=UPI00099643D9|nr:phosphoadenosine phosphosulfate reductase family protein [Streptomyces sp. NRRL B-24484]